MREYVDGSLLEVGEGGFTRRYTVGQKSGSPPTEAKDEGRRSKVEGQKPNTKSKVAKETILL